MSWKTIVERTAQEELDECFKRRENLERDIEQLEAAGIVVPVLVRAKLHRVDEDAADAAIAQRLAFLDQRHVAVVQVAHGRDEGNGLAVFLPVLHVLA